MQVCKKLNVMKKLIINRLDYARIRKCISDAKQFKSITDLEVERLMKELDSAKILEPEKIPSNVVTMNSIVKLSFLNTNKQVQFQIVYPDNRLHGVPLANVQPVTLATILASTSASRSRR